MAPFEALYGRKCRSPIDWFEVGEVAVSGPDSVFEAMGKVKLIRERLKTAQSRHKSYTDVRRRDLEFEVGDLVYLKISPMRGMKRFGNKGKLSLCYVGPYKILSCVVPEGYGTKKFPWSRCCGKTNLLRVQLGKLRRICDHSTCTYFPRTPIRPKGFGGVKVDRDNIDGTKNCGDADSIINSVISSVFEASSSLPTYPDVKNTQAERSELGGINVDTEDMIADVDGTKKFVNVDSTTCNVEIFVNFYLEKGIDKSKNDTLMIKMVDELPQQTQCDCGAFGCAFAEYFIHGRDIPKEIDIGYVRIRLTASLTAYHQAGDVSWMSSQVSTHAKSLVKAYDNCDSLSRG
ncbi:hypothetical protein FXO38_07396 [Capsicum annuum]|nr:hypothetical protein FXO38_07396 [Capsicum annuum]